MTPSPGILCSAIPKSRQRCSTSLSSSSKEPGSRSSSTRSRAVSFPSACWRSRRSRPPPSSARRTFSRSRPSRSISIPAWDPARRGGGDAAPPGPRGTPPTAPPATPTASATPGGDPPTAREREARELLLDLLVVTGGAAHGFAPGPHQGLEVVVAPGADVLVDGHDLPPDLAGHLLLGLLPILQESLQASVGQGVL